MFTSPLAQKYSSFPPEIMARANEPATITTVNDLISKTGEALYDAIWAMEPNNASYALARADICLNEGTEESNLYYEAYRLLLRRVLEICEEQHNKRTRSSNLVLHVGP